MAAYLPLDTNPERNPTQKDGRSMKHNLRDDDRFEGEDDARFEAVRKSIATRLKKACAYLPQSEFDALVEKMARVQIGRRGA